MPCMSLMCYWFSDNNGMIRDKVGIVCGLDFTNKFERMAIYEVVKDNIMRNIIFDCFGAAANNLSAWPTSK
ncbi:hypothetical protein FF1_030841 [Malus domestica]